MMNRSNNTKSDRHHGARVLRIAMLTMVFAFGLASSAHALTMSAPKHNAKLDTLEIYPTFVIEPAAGETPKWILVSERSDMANPIRYCRMFYGVYSANGIGWACRSLAVGVDTWGRDIPRPLAEGRRYFWNVTYTVDGEDQVSPTRPFQIRKEESKKSVAAISNAIMTDAKYVGLNPGKAAPSKSGVVVKRIKSRQTHRNRIVIEVRYKGAIWPRSSWVTVRGPGGTFKLRLKNMGHGKLKAVFRRPAASRAKKNARHKYQAFLVSRKNRAKVRSQENVMLFRHKG